MKFIFLVLGLILTLNGTAYARPQQAHFEYLKVSAPEYVIGENFTEIKLEAFNSKGILDSSINGKHEILLDYAPQVIDFAHGTAYTTVEISKTHTYTIQAGASPSRNFTIRYLPQWLSILPPLIAIVLALLTKEVIISLFVSIFFAVLTLKGFELENIIPSLLAVVDKYILETLNDTRHLSVIVFSFLIGGMVSVISHNGGMKGIVNLLARWAHSPRSAQLMTYFMSFGLFYDNYANTLIVGNTMRPVTDKYRVSREKLAFIVHCTAASITAIAFVSTWIGAELGYINDATSNLTISEKTYSLFLKSLQFSFYPILMLVFIFFLIFLKKDFGPMNQAEIAARNAGVIKENLEKEKKENEEIGKDIKRLEPEHIRKDRWLNAFIPVLLFIAVAFWGLMVTGARNIFGQLPALKKQWVDYSFQEVWQNLPALHPHHKEGLFAKLGVLISYSDFYIPLLWSSFSGISAAVFMAVVQKGITIRGTMENIVHGFRIMLPAVLILVFAWALADVLRDLHTTDYITAAISASHIIQKILPVIVFVLSALFSFATGSVWGTMAILYPLILPVSWLGSIHAGLTVPEAENILYMTIAGIVAGSVLGNQCSPISDTTTVSSISSNCDHVAHIRTQVPYTLTVAGVTLGLILFSLIGLHWTVNYLIGTSVLFVIVKYLGKPVE